jgi:putative ABC transport system permease protein
MILAVWTGTGLEEPMTVLGDIRYALRILARNPGFAAVALLTMALGVGANTAVFSVINATLFTPLPFPEADRLVAIHEVDRRAPGEHREISYPNFLDWQRAMRSTQSLAAYSAYAFTLETGDTTRRVEAARVSANYFNVLGVAARRGRVLEPRDDLPEAAPVIVIGDSLWADAFNRDPSAIGRVVRINESPATIVGIVGPNTAGPPDMTGIQDLAQLWAPIGRFSPTGSLNGRGSPFITPVVARLRPGVSLQQAQQEIDAVAAELERQYPTNRNRGAAVVTFVDQYFRNARPILLILLGTVGFVLLIACANLSSLLLARANARQREIAVRAALGAGRWRIVRLVLAESLLISTLGGALGLLTAAWLIDGLVALSPASLPSFVRIAIDTRVVLFTLVVCTTSGTAFGLAPAVMGSRTDVTEGLKPGLRGGGSPFLRRRLVTTQIAVALVLVVGAALMLRTLERLRAFDPGFELEGLLAVTVSLPGSALGSKAEPRTHERLKTMLGRVRGLPGVRSASLTWDVPLVDVWLQTRVRLVDREADPVLVRRHPVGPGHFRTLGIPMLEGRDFTADDNRSASQYVAIISRRMAQRYWPEGSALHKLLRHNDRTLEIVGVAGDVQHERLLQPATADPDLYVSLEQASLLRVVTFAVRTADAAHTAAAIREIVRDAGNSMSVFRVRTGEDILAAQTARERFVGLLLAIFSLIALALTLVGIYGVTAYDVSRQRRDIAIRMALGATRGDVLYSIVRGEAPSILQGLALGIIAALALTGTLSAMLHGVSSTDPGTFALVTGLIAIVATLACLIPARLASRVDPAVTFRAE